MSKRTIILLNEKTGWVAGGQDGSQPVLQEWSSLSLDGDSTVQMTVEAIVASINEQKLPKRNVVLILGPSYLEYRPFQVPPVDNKEMPSLAQMLARTQLTQANDQSVIDFVPMPNSSAQGSHQSFIAATTQKTNLLLEELQEKGVQCQRVLPRTTALGLLHNDPSDRQFWINVQQTEIDVFVAGLEQLLLVRSSILPGSGEARAKALHREVARTLAVLGAEYGTSSHRRIEIAGVPADRDIVKQAFSDGAEQCHDLTPTDIGKETVEIPDAEQGMAIVALAALAEKHAALLDFANPTQPPRDSELTRKLILAGSLAATVVVCLVGLAWINLNRIGQDLAKVQQKISMLESSEESSQEIINNVGQVNTFLSDDVGALEVLETFSSKLPYGDQLRLKSLNLSRDIRSETPGVKVAIKSFVAGSGSEKYRQTLNELENWQISTSPVQRMDVGKDSDYYTGGVDETLLYVPDFEKRYEQYLTVFDAAQQQPASEEAVEQDNAEDVKANVSDEPSAKEAEDDNVDEGKADEDEADADRISTTTPASSAPDRQ